MSRPRVTERTGLTTDNATLLQAIEEKAALLTFAVAGSSEDADAIEPVVTLSRSLHSDVLNLMECLDVAV